MPLNPRSVGESSWLRPIALRVGVSAVIWCGFGLVAGLCTAPEATPIGVLAGLIAGVIVLTPMGVILGLMGGRWLEMLLGGGLGMAGGAAAALVQGSAWGQPAAVGLISGGLVGATFVTTFWRLPRMLTRFVRPRASEHHVKQPVLA